MDDQHAQDIAISLRLIQSEFPTLRDRFAMAALQGMCVKLAATNAMSGEPMIDGGTDGLGPLCWEIADTMLRVREANRAS